MGLGGSEERGEEEAGVASLGTTTTENNPGIMVKWIRRYSSGDLQEITAQSTRAASAKLPH